MRVMKKSNSCLVLLVAVIFVAELYSRWNNIHFLEYIAKPFLLIWIAVFYFLNTRSFRKDVFIYLAFLFSWTGDMFLMLAHINGLFFYVGVGGFFLAQLSYIKVFTSCIRSDNKGYLFKRPVLLIPFAVYLSAILVLITGKMEGIMIPVIIVYAFALILMSVTALNRKTHVNKASFNFVFWGSVLFVISDSMIAINKFYAEFPRSSFLIMLTYFTAQVLIMTGLIVKDKK